MTSLPDSVIAFRFSDGRGNLNQSSFFPEAP